MSVLNQLDIYTLKGNDGMDLNALYGLGVESLENYDLSDFTTICPEFKNLFDGNEKNRYNILFSLYLKQAKEVITQEYGDNMLICATWYIAHYLQLNLSAIKNIENSANLDSQKLEDNMKYNQGSKESKIGTASSLMQKDLERTIYGQNLLQVMRFIGKVKVLGVY